MAEVDRVMVEDLGISLLQMMENAGRSLAQLAIEVFNPQKVLILSGTGGNGGGGLVAARHLANRGVGVEVVLTNPDALAPVSRHQFEILSKMNVAISDVPNPSDLIIDAVIGYSLKGDPSGRAEHLIDWANSSYLPILSLDNPSGLDVSSGVESRSTIKATATMTLALPKSGLVNSKFTGTLFLADISVPRKAYEALGILAPSIFAKNQIVELATSGGNFYITQSARKKNSLPIPTGQSKILPSDN